ncbi:Dysferlin [Schistosoma japonicum]|nr:Dysferlin [Schistosoma japonicum]
MVCCGASGGGVVGGDEGVRTTIGGQDETDSPIGVGKRKKKLGSLAVRPQYSTKKQDFQIRVKIIEARQLQGANISPICKVTCWKESKDTRVRNCTNSPFWDQIFFFNFFDSAAELLDQHLIFTVYDSRRLRRDSLIGSFKFDLSLVYECDRHSMLNKWLLLCNPEDPMSGARGYLKISVVILEPGDEAPSMKVSESDEKEDIEGNLLRPAGVQLRSAVFKILLYMAEDLPRMDSDAFKGIKNLLSTSDEEKEFVDPYAVVSFAGKSIKSSTKYGTDHPEWNEEITMNIQFPSMCEKLKFTFFDWDRGSKDDAIGTATISLTETSSQGTDGFLPTFGPSFVNLYGSPREYSDLPDKYEALNLGKGQGVAYRGRVLLEISTELLDEPIADSVKPLEQDKVARIQKSLRRRKYQLYTAFLSATMIEEKRDGPIEFEVSIGNHGNKLDESVTPCASTTPPTNPISDGLHYYYLPWGDDKPCTMVDSQWEDISFRLGAVNLLLRIADHLERGISHLMVAIKANLPIETQAHHTLPQWEPENIPQNEIDIHLRKLREDQLNTLREQAINTRETVSEIDDALKELKAYREAILNLAIEPQMSIPDIIIWMLCSGKRIAYHRIPAHEVLYHDNEDYRGMKCGTAQTINLKRPILLKDENKSDWKIPAQLRVVVWFGLEKDRAAWTESHNEAKLQVVAETYENQASIVGNWVTKRPPLTRPPWSDNTGRIDLPKDSIQLPTGWEWVGDWFVSPELSLLYKKDAGKTSFVEELFYNEFRTPTSPWKVADPAYTDAQGEPKGEPRTIELPSGWTWGDDWKIDYNRPCDEDGFEYTVEASTGGYVAAEKLYHMFRRRRLIRSRILGEVGVPVKQENSYSPNYSPYIFLFKMYCDTN